MASKNSSLSVRPASATDRGAVLAVAAASGLFSPEEVGEIAELVDAFTAGSAGADRWLVGETGAGLEAIAYYAPERMTHGTWNLYLLAVHPDGQGRGFGRTMVRAVEQDLRADGARLLLIETSGTPEFTGQRAFYASLGYRQEATIRQFYDTADDKVVYAHDLAAADDVPATSTGVASFGPRPAGRGDLDRLVELAAAFYAEDGFATGVDQLRANLGILVNGGVARVAVIDAANGPVAFGVTTVVFGLENGLIAELEDLYVDPAHRRNGLAQLLIEDSADWSRRTGARQLEVVIAPNGRDVDHLETYYRRRGFADDGRRLIIRTL